MSSSTPGPTDGSNPEVEYLGEQPVAPAKRRRTGIVVAAAVGAVAAAGAGAWAVTQFMSGGDAAATAVPADALGYVSLDLDPDGGQKIEAVQTLRKFPAIREELDIDGSEDLQRVLYDALTAEDPCPDLDYGDDIEPWLGGKLAVSAMPGDGDGAEPVPFFVVQVKDQEAATDGIAKIFECVDDEAGTAFVGDFMVVAETEEIADDLAADAQESSLADDDEFGRWIDEAGGSGILEAYVAKEGAKLFMETLAEEQLPTDLDPYGATESSVVVEDLGGAEPLVSAEGLDPSTAPTPDLDKALEEFEGAAFVVRFDDEALEMEAAGGGLPTDVELGGDSGITDLPATTALAFGMGVADGAVQDLIDGFTESAGLTEEDVEEMLAEAEAQSGLELPEDIQKLLGDGLSVAVDSSVDMDAMINSSEPPSDLPAGVRIVGDPEEITEVLDKLREAAGPMGDELVVEEGDGVVAIGIDADYVAKLAEDGALGDEERFETAMQDADTGTGGFFVDFDAGDWLTELAALDSDERLEENVAPLDSLGISGSIEDDAAHWIVRLTTD